MRRLLRTLICQARVTTIPDKLAELVFMFFIIKGFSKFQEVQHYSRGKTILISAFLFFLVFLFQQKLPGEICVTQTGILDIPVLFNQDTNIFYTITILYFITPITPNSLHSALQPSQQTQS